MIVGFDGSDSGHDGLALSMGLAKASGARIVVAYVYDESLSASSAEAADELADHAEAVLTSAREQVGQVLDVSFRGVASSSPAHGIHELAMTCDADLIVVGSRRLGPLTRVALGGVSRQVIYAAPCAVALAPRGYRNDGGFVPRAFGVGWLPTDEGDHALAVASKLAKATGGSVHLVTTRDVRSSAQRPGDRQAGKVSSEVLPEAMVAGATAAPVAIGAPVRDLADGLIERSCSLDLIVLGSPRQPAQAQLGQIASRVLDEARCPVLILSS